MDFLIGYAVFCFTTAIMANIYLLRPVLVAVNKSQPLNPVISYAFITHAVFFLVSLLIAPAVLLSVIVPTFGDRFRFTLTESLEAK